MADVLLMLKRLSLGEGLCSIIEESGIGKPILETRYENLLASTECEQVKVVLLEVPESGLPNIYGCLAIIDQLKIRLPNCKVLLMCSELDHEAVKVAIKAQQSKRVDNFIFYDTSMEYLKASIKALL